MKNHIYIDGVKTRENLSILAGKMNGTKAVCEELGVSTEAVNKACRLGYGTPSTITKFLVAGIPVVVSAEPIPCRRKQRHTRGGKPEAAQPAADPEKEKPREPQAEAGRQLTFDDISLNDFRLLLICHIEAITTELNSLLEDLRTI